MSAQRVALVIGNSNYDHVPVLANPRNDASDIGAALERLGFVVTPLENVGYDSFRKSLQEFKRAASVSKVAAVFYAGHGIEVDQRNFLVPVDARLASDQDVEFETVPLDLVMRALDGASELRLVILDACRDNPFAAKMQRSGATRSIGRGLARLEPPEQTLVAYSAEAGTVASDGDGRNSPYTAALLRHIEESGLELDLMFRHVRDSVLSSTGGSQRPFTYGSLSSQGTYLTERGEAEPVEDEKEVEKLVVISLSSSDEQLATERLFWESIKDLTNAEYFQAYIDQYPDGAYVKLARIKLKVLKDASEKNTTTGVDAQLNSTVEQLPEPSFESVDLSLNLTRPERSNIQKGLVVAGFDPGAADGLFGQRTRVAIGKWQLSRGVDKTGYLDAKSAKVLIALAAEFVPARSPGDVFRDCKSCPQMVVVPAAGDFMMGSPSSEKGRVDDESPRHRVTITKSFAVGKHEVTRGQYAVFARLTGHSPSGRCWIYDGSEWKESDTNSWRNPGFVQGEDDPVVCVSWEDAQAFVGWLSRETGQDYRLLTESEWEYAARAGTKGPFHFGSTISTGQANYNGNYTYKKGRKGVNRQRTVPVGSFPSNKFGLHDMHGNVWEWVEDCWHSDYSGAPTDGSAWISGGDCDSRVLRGGSWSNVVPWNLRAADRYRLCRTGLRSNSVVGFRVARTLTP